MERILSAVTQKGFKYAPETIQFARLAKLCLEHILRIGNIEAG